MASSSSSSSGWKGSACGCGRDMQADRRSQADWLELQAKTTSGEAQANMLGTSLGHKAPGA
jgi:hypothetical protein